MVDTVSDMLPALRITDAEGLASAQDGHIDFEGLPNTRDLGGMLVADGRFIKHKLLLRSGALYKATERDISVLLDEYHLRTVVDLRTEEERREHPDPEDALMGVHVEDVSVLNAATLGITHEGGVLSALKALRAVQKHPAQVMIDLYPDMLLSENSQRGFAEFFNSVVATEEGSVLWHCTVGKDRAGLATALLLHTLGVPTDAIKTDYEVTNRYVESRSQDIMDTLATYGLADKLDESIQILNSADPRFLQAALDAVAKRYGSLDAYVRDVLGVADETRDLLRARYLTDDPQA